MALYFDMETERRAEAAHPAPDQPRREPAAGLRRREAGRGAALPRRLGAPERRDGIVLAVEPLVPDHLAVTEGPQRGLAAGDLHAAALAARRVLDDRDDLVADLAQLLGLGAPVLPCIIVLPTASENADSPRRVPASIAPGGLTYSISGSMNSSGPGDSCRDHIS